MTANPGPGVDRYVHWHGGRCHSHPFGDRPHSHAQSARDKARRLRIAGGATAVIVAVIGLFVPWLTLSGERFSVSQAHSACSSVLGQIAQGLSNNIAADCGAVTTGYYVLIVAAISGVALVIWGFLAPGGPRPPQVPPPGYPTRPGLSGPETPPGYR